MKRFLTLLIALILSNNFATAEVTIYQNGDSQFSMGLREGDRVILPPVYWVREESEYTIWYSAGVNGPYGFYDKASGCLHPAEFDYVSDDMSNDSTAPVLVGLDGYYGYVYRDRCEIAIPLKYQTCGDYSEFENGCAIIGKYTYVHENGCQFMLIDRYGNEIIFPEDYEPFSLPTADGLLILINPQTGLLGIGDTTGQVVVSPIYEGIGGISEGYISYCIQGKWGHMDTLGTIILPPTYELYYDPEDIDCPWGYHFKNGVATLWLSSKDGSWHEVKIDYEGNLIP